MCESKTKNLASIDFDNKMTDLKSQSSVSSNFAFSNSDINCIKKSLKRPASCDDWKDDM